MNNIKDIKREKVKLYNYEIDFIKKLSKLRIKQKNDRITRLQNKRYEKFDAWYKENRYSLNTFFYNVMTFIDRKEINLNSSNQDIYNKFIEFAFKNSELIFKEYKP